MILRLDHAAISVPDLDRALAFYCGLLGFEVEVRWDWEPGTGDIDTLVGLSGSAARSAILKLGGTRIELFEFLRPAGAPQDAQRPVSDHGITHLCFVVDDIAREHARLQEAGVSFNSAPVRFGRASFVYGRDPFGNVFELKQVWAPRPESEPRP